MRSIINNLRILNIVVLLLLASYLPAAELRILPGDFILHGREGHQKISVVMVQNDRVGAEVSGDELRIESSDPNVVRIQDGAAVAVADGNAKISARISDGTEATVAVQVVDVESEHPWSFRNDVQSIFSKIWPQKTNE